MRTLSILGLLAMGTCCWACRDVPQDDEEVTPVVIDAPQTAPSPREVELRHVRVIRRYPHARDAFTQGLLFHDGALYESTGQYGHSSLRKVEIKTGRVLKSEAIERSFFAEGLARVDDRLVQLTWKEGRALLWSLKDFKSLGQLRYDGQGWGLCYNGEHLVMSDGSDTLSLRDPSTFKIARRLRVKRAGRKVQRLNELECVGDEVYANVWQSPEIIKIDLDTGDVLTSVNAGGLLTPKERVGTDVLNGIAYLPQNGHFLITGKNWPWVFEVAFEKTTDP